MKRVYICAPLGGNTEENLKKVRRYTEYALRLQVRWQLLLLRDRVFV